MLTFDQARRNLKLVRNDIDRATKVALSGQPYDFSPLTLELLDEVLAMFNLPKDPPKMSPTPSEECLHISDTAP